MSCWGYVVTYVVFPVLWYNNLQTEITLIMMEAEYIVLSQLMRFVIPFMDLMKEISFIVDIYIPNPGVFLKLFKDYQSCIAVTESKENFQEQKTSLLIITISKVLYKIKSFLYVTLI